MAKQAKTKTVVPGEKKKLPSNRGLTKGWRRRTSDPEEPLADLRRERFCCLIADGMSAIRAYELAGYARDLANPSKLMRDAAIVQRIRFLELQAARARGEDSELTRQRVRRNLDHIGKVALHAGQLSIAMQCEIWIGRDVGMFAEKHEHTLQWDGDPRKLTEAQRVNLMTHLAGIAFRGDPKLIEEARAEAERTIDATAEVTQ